MSAASAALNAGFSALLSAAGESVDFRDETLTAVIDREPFRRAIPTPDFNPRDISVVEIRAADVDSIPVAGENFTDEEGLRHRVKFVSRRGGTYRCECKVSEPPNEGLSTGTGSQLLTGMGIGLKIGAQP